MKLFVLPSFVLFLRLLCCGNVTAHRSVYANRKRERQRWMWYRTNLSTLPLSPVFIILFFILLFVFYVYGRVEYMLNGIYTALRCHIWVHAESAEQRAHEMYDIIAACIRIEQRNIYFEQENKWKRWKKNDRNKSSNNNEQKPVNAFIYISIRYMWSLCTVLI